MDNSEDNSTPLGNHINSLVLGVTPYVTVVVPPPGGGSPGAPEVTNFTISDEKVIWLLSGAFVAQATLAWDVPQSALYAGVMIYLVDVTGNYPPLTTFPKQLSGMQSNVDTNFILDVANIPSNPEVWTLAAISVSTTGQMSDNPADYGQPGFNAPTVTWDIGPPTPGEPGGGEEYAPLVTLDPNAAATATQSVSSDGIGMVSFEVGDWTDPTSNQFGGAQVAMVVNNDPLAPVYWSVPGGATSFTTPAMPSFGNVGANVPVDFYIVSDNPQGQKNTLVPGVTPVIAMTYTPSAGQIIPARSGWFDESQFQWPTTGQFNAYSLAAQIVEVGSTLIVGGAPASFGGSDNGQIAVLNSSGGLVAWMGQQQPEQGNGAPLWGAWFGQLWVGGTEPLNAPLFIDQQGIIEVGGIAAAQGSAYPYISVRTNTGLEAGRIGAMISAPTGLPEDGTGPAPPQLTSGAWFNEFAAGGSNLSNWCVLLTPDATNPLGSDFQMRNIVLLEIDYAAQQGNPANYQYHLDFGSSVWIGSPGLSDWQFPGIRIYEMDGGSNLFGSTYINRGMILRGTITQGYPTLAALVMFNGDTAGSDYPQQFYGVLEMSSPFSPYNQNVIIQSGLATGSPPVVTSGAASMALRDTNGNPLFATDTAGNCSAYTFNVIPYGQVINTAGEWVGAPISGGGQNQTPWLSNINGNNWSLSGVNGITAVNIDATNQLSCSGNLLCYGSVESSGWVNSATGFLLNGVQVPIYWGGSNPASTIWGGSMQSTQDCFAGMFGIDGVSEGWPQGQLGFPAGENGNINLMDADGVTPVQIVVNGGIIIQVNPGAR